MTDFGRAAGDMLKSVYDVDLSGVVDDVEALPAHAADHQNAGDDEISVAALSGELADDQPPKAHLLGSASHSADSLVNLNLKVSDATLDDSADTRTPTAHAASHQDAGTDEIVATGLVGRVNRVDRGDPSSFDWVVGTLTTDGSYNELDCSSIVPAGAIAIDFHLEVQYTSSGYAIEFRKKGNTNAINRRMVQTQVNAVTIPSDFLVPCGSDRIVEYKGTNATWTTFNLVVAGWFI